MSLKDRDWYWQNINNPGQHGEPPERRPPRWRRLLAPLLWLILLGALAGGAWALWHAPNGQAWVQMRWHALLGRLGLEQPAHAAPASPGRYSDSPRPLAECIKPGNLIDDEVRACVKGYRAKTW